MILLSFSQFNSFTQNGHAFDTYDDKDSENFVHTSENYCIDDEFKLHICFEDDPTQRIKDDYPYCE